MGIVASYMFSLGAVATVIAFYGWTKSWEATFAAGAFVAFLWGGFWLAATIVETAIRELDRNVTRLIDASKKRDR